MTLEEAIKHAEAAAIENEKEAKRKREHGGWFYDNEAHACSICAEQHRQLAEWLKELAERRKQPEIVYCKDCKHKGTRNCVANALTIAFHTEVKDDFYCGLAERRTDG